MLWCKQIIMLAHSAPNLFLLFLKTSPAVENTLSAVTDEAGVIRCFIAASNRNGKLDIPSLSHHSIGSVERF